MQEENQSDVNGSTQTTESTDSKLFGKAIVDETVKTAKERKQNIEKGYQEMILKKVEFTESKVGNNPMIVITCNKIQDRSKYFDITSYYVINKATGYRDDSGALLSVTQIIKFFYNSFGYTIKEEAGENEVSELVNLVNNQLVQFEKKEFKAAIMHKEQLNSAQNDIQVRAALYYTGEITDVKFTPDSINLSYCYKTLSAKDKAILESNRQLAQQPKMFPQDQNKPQDGLNSEANKGDDIPF